MHSKECACCQGNHQNFEPSLLSKTLTFMGMIFFIFEKQKTKWPTQKNWVFQNHKFSKNFAKISENGSWISRIDWCVGHWCGSTYVVVRLSDISSKPGKKCIYGAFRLFLSLCRTASRPYRLSHINPLCINQSY